MKIGLVRAVDFWLGIPMCFLLTVFCKIKNLIFTINKDNPKKIIFLQLSEIGSAVLSYGSLLTAKSIFPEAQLYYCIFEENKDAVKALNVIAEPHIFTIRSRNLGIFIWDTFINIIKIHKEKIDTVIDMELFSRFSSVLAYLIGAGKRVGFYRNEFQGIYRGRLHTHKVCYNPHIHISKNFVSLVVSLKISPDKTGFLREIDNYKVFVPRVEIKSIDRKRILERFKDYDLSKAGTKKVIVINYALDSKLKVRMWPQSYYGELINRLIENEDILIVLVGLGKQRLSDEFDNKRVINLINQTKIKDLLALFSIASALVSHDGGILHIASLTNINIIALFGPETPLLYEPLTDKKEVFYKKLPCSPCLSAYNHRTSLCKDNRCMKVITFEEVYEAVIRRIGEG